jgi:adenine deaminase
MDNRTTRGVSAQAGSDRERGLAISLRRETADAVVRNCVCLDVHTGALFPGGIAIAGERIAFVGDVADLIGPGTQIIEGRGRIAVPGLIDGHIHTYETHLPVSEVARGMFRHGITTVVTDFYGEAVVGGLEAVRASLNEAAASPLNVVFVLPVPALYQDSPFVHTGTIDLAAMEEMASWPQCQGLNECFAMSIAKDEPVMRRLVDVVQANGGKICGHGSEVAARVIQAWSGWVGRLDDHESATGEEALARLRAGIHVIAREGSGVANLASIVEFLVAKGADLRRVSFCTDVLSPVDLLAHGSIDRCIRMCIDLGVPPVTAVQMATLNAAECHQIDHDVGSLAPGRRADLILLEGSIAEFQIGTVMAAGKIVMEAGQDLQQTPAARRPDCAYNTVRTGQVTPDKFAVKAPAGAQTALVRVIGVCDGSVITQELHRRLPVRAGLIEPEGNVNAIAAIERQKASGATGLGFVEGFGLKSGAMATTFAPQSQHLVVVGANRQDMALAAAECARLGGGFVVADQGRVAAHVPLPLYGLLSEESVDVVTAQIEAAIQALRRLGCPLATPFHTLAFTSLPISIGTLKVTSVGLVDVWKEQIVPLLLE